MTPKWRRQLAAQVTAPLKWSHVGLQYEAFEG
jgi:hypothetical protein